MSLSGIITRASGTVTKSVTSECLWQRIESISSIRIVFTGFARDGRAIHPIAIWAELRIVAPVVPS
jgi:hypothetical protein